MSHEKDTYAGEYALYRHDNEVRAPLEAEIEKLRARLATAEAQVAAAQSERDMTRAMAAERAALRAGLAAAEEQLADANRGYSLLCDEEARLNDDLAAASRALEEMRQALKNAQYKSMMIVLSAVEAGEEREFIKWVQQEAKHIEKECAVAALLAPERPR